MTASTTMKMWLLINSSSMYTSTSQRPTGANDHEDVGDPERRSVNDVEGELGLLHARADQRPDDYA
jgi:hypothetical protein